ncbi:HAMP domain-containing histidine kinase [Flavobacterium psychrophilum]|uniref:sensor histidine kinase n=1 Tax=Flavobacterium psychrophilum TaxID=96345 RepID=UPI000A3CAAC8|nr:HAMP domain-containing sensor histidine kinase [Flavobacterium psychrophilum]EKT3966891.1 HAMP domain-containing histidine kinase [Flavobacterium psychrophilum]ELY2017956.1 HAMP domain-containing histidine kinase [Flavobacterium psychrophilum]OUD26032.1 two-component sensor histidine kinase [Flavobacterium psychrophilum]SNB19900.1 Two-component system sensor histidine kinase PorY [Flavobacterium psychrophilum]SNB24186.1 Two-component system sensor histidine kinase PorY [Flavobacterium psych
MQFSNNKNTTRWFLIISSFLITVLILWNTYTFFQIFKNEERLKIELWAEAQKSINDASSDTDLDLPFQIISNNNTIPILLTNEKDSILQSINIDERIIKDSIKAKALLLNFKNANKRVEMEYVKGKFHYLYYTNSPLLNKLKYYPIALLLIIFLFGALVYNYYKTNKMSGQNKLWAGMAKETAHQIGTPLSSLIGWVEIMKSDNVDETMVEEIEKDIHRLLNITDRFSKIGSEPVLEQTDLVEETQKSYEYLQSRFSKQVIFTFKAPEHKIPISINPILHSWTIENLVKNAIDAMKGRGSIAIIIEDDWKTTKIKITDSGKGIPKNQFKTIFEPGFTTKKRGWGLGLSLTKRIVEEYHNGRIKVLQSELNKGTTIEISFKR